MKKSTRIILVFFFLSSVPLQAQWSLTGNDGVNAATNFVGTLNSADLVFKTDNAERMRINTLGNVGIGTVNPVEALDVNGRIKSAALSMGPWPADASSFVFWGTNALNQSSSENYALLQGATGSNLGRTYLNSPLDIRFRIKNNDKMVLAANGNVGIGIASPAQELHVFKSGINADIRLQTDLAANYLDVFCGNNRAGLWGYDKASLEFATDGKLRMFISGTDGRVGIGTSLPEQDLHIKAVGHADIRLEGSGIHWNIGAGEKFYFAHYDHIAKKYNDHLTILPSGNIGIGTINPQSKLAVNGKITAKEVEVTLNGWADFVFKPNYKLLPLSEVEKFIKENRHLPGVPSETEILSKNQNLGEMNALLMQKIEELTLYVIELKRELEGVKKTK